MASLREREGKKDSHSPNSARKGDGDVAVNGEAESMKKRPLEGDGASVTEGKGIQLKRQVGLISGIALIVGTMIGSGIFVSPKGVLTQTQSVGMGLIVWLACGILATMGALCYAELGTIIPKSGGEYSYLKDTFGNLPAFLYAYVSTIMLKPSSLSIITLSFGQYVTAPFLEGDCINTSILVKMLAATAISALCYAELGTLIPKSGAEYAYLWYLGPVPAYLFSWTSTLVLKPSSLSIIALSFGAYVAEPFFQNDCRPPTIAVKLFAVLAILLIVFINCASVKWATAVQNFFTAAKLLALVVIIVVGFVKMIQGNVKYLSPSTSFEGSSVNVFAYGIAFYQGLWAYDGWNQLNYITEELKHPNRNLPLAIIIGIPLVTILYLLVNIAYFTVMSPEELLQSGAVAVTFANRTLGPMAWIIPFFVCCSTFGAANGSLFTAGRLTFVAAREGHMVEILSMVHVKRYTPFPALVFQSFIAILMLLPGDFESLVNYFSFAAWLFYGGTVSALLYLRYKHPEWHRPIKVPIVLPIIVLIASVYLVIAPIIDEPQLEYLFAFLFILAGLLFYVPFVHYKYELPFMKHITVFLQLLLEVAPTSHFDDSERDENA